MIKETLEFLAGEANAFLSAEPGGNTEARVVLGDITKTGSGDSEQTAKLLDKTIISLVNIEEDQSARQRISFVKADPVGIRQQPPTYLSLYVLFAANYKEYSDSMQQLAHIMQFFQNRNVFDSASNMALDTRIERLIIDLYPMNFEQISYLWSTLGVKYIPSVVYKIRQIILNDAAIS